MSSKLFQDRLNGRKLDLGNCISIAELKIYEKYRIYLLQAKLLQGLLCHIISSQYTDKHLRSRFSLPGPHVTEHVHLDHNVNNPRIKSLQFKWSKCIPRH